MTVAGTTSTGSKRPQALFGQQAADQARHPRMVRSAGAFIWDDAGRRYLDFVMGLGAVALGYGHPAVVEAARGAVERGIVGSLPPVEEEVLARVLHGIMPWLEQVRFLKTGAEAVAAAVRLARVATGRDLVVGCGYHGWLDWSSREAGVPVAVEGLYEQIPFNDPERGRALIREHATKLACVVIEPVIDGPPSPEWLGMLREETERAGALLVFDEVKTALRVALGGAAERWGGRPDLVVLGKAIGNGFPLAVVGGRAEIMALVDRTWISSTLATETVSLAAGIAAIETARAERLPDRLAKRGAPLLAGFERISHTFPDLVERAAGLPEMCHLVFRDQDVGGLVAARCFDRGLLIKRTAYNFVSLAHTGADVEQALDVLEESIASVGRR